MAFSHSQHTDARWSTFNDIQGNQTVQTYFNDIHVHVHVNNLDASFGQGLGGAAGLDDLSNVLQNLSSHVLPLAQGLLVPSAGSSSTETHLDVRTNHGDLQLQAAAPTSSSSLPSSGRRSLQTRNDEIVGNTASLIPPIVQLLMGDASSSSTRKFPDRSGCTTSRKLKVELELLYQTLTLTGLALQAYAEGTPLSQTLVNAIHPETERCRVELQALSNRLGLGAYDPSQRGRQTTSVRDVWRQVGWSGWGDERDLASPLLLERLERHRKTLGQFLLALGSVAWMEHRNGFFSSGITSLKRFLGFIRQSPPSLRHIELHKVLVVDHLGRNLPVPMLFCSTWKDFNYIINGYCKDLIGDRFVKRGDYHVIRARDNAVVDISKLPKIVKPGMVLEMSIVLHQINTFQDIKEKCPRCRHINSNANAVNGWIEWKVRRCSGQFQVAKTDHDIRKKPENRDEYRVDTRQGEEPGERRSRPTESEDDVQEIISPSSQAASDDERKTTEYETGDEDGTHLFRRIHVICEELVTLEQNSQQSNPGDRKWVFVDLTGRISRQDQYPHAHGGFADLYLENLEIKSSPHPVAIKVFRLKRNNPADTTRILERFCREIDVWQRLLHPNILGLLGVTFDFGSYPSTVSPWLGNGNIREYIQRNEDSLSATDRLRFVSSSQLRNSVHSQSVIHGDLSGTNVLVTDDGRACLCDYGVANILGEVYEASSSDAFFRWAAPEIVRHEGNTPLSLNQKTDVYSFGSTMLEILSGRVPYHYVKRNTQVYQMLRDREKPRRPMIVAMTDEYWDFIRRCWDDNPLLRPTASEAVDCIYGFHLRSRSFTNTM